MCIRDSHNPDRKLERALDQWPFPDRDGVPVDYIESMPLDLSLIHISEPTRPY